MSALDVRTRTAADIRPIDVTTFFEDELPRLLADRSHLAAAGAAEFDPQSLTITTDSGSWTLSYSPSGFELITGASGVTTIQLSDESFSEMVNEIATLEMLFNLKLVQLVSGNRDEAHCWAVILRSLLDERPMYTAGAVVLRDRDGRPLDLDRAFTPDSDDAEMAHFLAETGYLHLSGWLDEELMHEIADDMNRAFAACTPDDGSWWVDLADGSRRPARILDFAAQSAAVGRLATSEPFLRVGRLSGDGYQWSPRVEALQKPIGVVRGISDIPWHSDCATGMHSYVCRDLTVGIQVTGAGPGSAQLGVLPGSHRALMPTNRHYPSTGFEPRFLTTQTGDMTVHCSCLMHTALPPTEYERKVLYTGFALLRDPELDRVLAEINARREVVAGAMMAGE